MKVVLISVLFILSLQAHADNSRELCKGFGEIAELIMTHRQNGTPMDVIIDKIDKEPALKDIGESLAISAYETSRFSTEKMKQRKITEFKNAVYLECLKGSKGN